MQANTLQHMCFHETLTVGGMERGSRAARHRRRQCIAQRGIPVHQSRSPPSCHFFIMAQHTYQARAPELPQKNRTATGVGRFSGALYGEPYGNNDKQRAIAPLARLSGTRLPAAYYDA